MIALYFHNYKYACVFMSYFFHWKYLLTSWEFTSWNTDRNLFHNVKRDDKILFWLQKPKIFLRKELLYKIYISKVDMNTNNIYTIQKLFFTFKNSIRLFSTLKNAISVRKTLILYCDLINSFNLNHENTKIRKYED